MKRFIRVYGLGLGLVRHPGLNNESVDHANTPEEPRPRKGLGSGALSSC